MSPQFTTALVRAGLGGVLTGALTFLTTYSSTGSLRGAEIAGGIALCGYMLTRGGVEGWLDTNRAAGPASTVR